MKQLLVLILTGTFSIASSQNVFFKSTQKYNDQELKKIYSSIRIEGNTLIFHATNYTLYAYDLQSGKELWNVYLSWKSTVAPYFVGKDIWVNKDNSVIRLDGETGRELGKLPMSEVLSQPVIRNGIVYATGIYDMGQIFAYDPKGDSILWSRFLAHGCSEKPYYYKDRIVANAEGNNWLEMEYNGNLKAKDCDTMEYRFPSELSCVKTFWKMTHDSLEISEKISTKLFHDSYANPELFSSATNSFIIHEGHLIILGNKLKKKSDVNLEKISEDTVGYDELDPKIIGADDQRVRMFYRNQLLVYNFKKSKLEYKLDLTQWSPLTVLSDKSRIWLISRNDGLLYGIETGN